MMKTWSPKALAKGYSHNINSILLQKLLYLIDSHDA